MLVYTKHLPVVAVLSLLPSAHECRHCYGHTHELCPARLKPQLTFSLALKITHQLLPICQPSQINFFYFSEETELLNFIFHMK